MKHSKPRGWKTHFFTKDTHTNGTIVWYRASCKMVSSGEPTSKADLKQDPVDCLRCLKALGQL